MTSDIIECSLTDYVFKEQIKLVNIIIVSRWELQILILILDISDIIVYAFDFKMHWTLYFTIKFTNQCQVFVVKNISLVFFKEN